MSPRQELCLAVVFMLILPGVFRLLGQLDETETAFDDFWERHHTKLQQCLQLRHFEHSYREVCALCLIYSE